MTSLNSLLTETLQDLYDAETQSAAVLSSMAQTAYHTELQGALAGHRTQTEGQIKRLNDVFVAISSGPIHHPCPTVRGLIREANAIIGAEGHRSVKDAAMIGAAQQLAHYKIAAYGTACALAEQLRLSEVEHLLDKNLDQEKAADEMLTKLSTGRHFSMSVNEDAVNRPLRIKPAIYELHPTR